jgi:AraC-like DNA-binding protein
VLVTEVGPLESGWRQLSTTDVRRAIDEVKGTQSLPGELLEIIARSFVVRTDRPVRFQAQRRHLGGLDIATLVMPELRFSGLPFHRSTTVHVAFVLEGEVTVQSRGGLSSTLTAGEACVISNWSLFDVSCTESTRVIHVLLPESRLRERGVRVRPERFLLDGPRTLGAPIVALAQSLLDVDWRPTPSAVRVAEHAMEALVVGLLLEWEDRALDREDLRYQLRRRALEEITTRHRDPDLTPALVARSLGVSLRHLQRGFEHSGTTVAQQISIHRTESAAELLSSPGGAALTVTEVARATGFGSAFELRSAFRARFGLLPSAFRSNNVAPARE